MFKRFLLFNNNNVNALFDQLLEDLRAWYSFTIHDIGKCYVNKESDAARNFDVYCFGLHAVHSKMRSPRHESKMNTLRLVIVETEVEL